MAQADLVGATLPLWPGHDGLCELPTNDHRAAPVIVVPYRTPTAEAPMLNLAVLLEDSARNDPERVAVAYGPARLTYAELDAKASQVAGALAARGVGPGDRVALSCPKLPYFPIVYYGILKAGATVVP